MPFKIDTNTLKDVQVILALFIVPLVTLIVAKVNSSITLKTKKIDLYFENQLELYKKLVSESVKTISMYHKFQASNPLFISNQNAYRDLYEQANYFNAVCEEALLVSSVEISKKITNIIIENNNLGKTVNDGFESDNTYKLESTIEEFIISARLELLKITR